ncbi:hypothetical protein KAR91_33760 [Candidatus Pacearchaeota archaeon]|nr:hypothetical protein [Candidatus Pacearchaeota archaeon]
MTSLTIIHHAPKSVWRSRVNFSDQLSAKQRHYLNYSVERYCKDPGQKRLYDGVQEFMKNPEMGVVENFRFIESPRPGSIDSESVDVSRDIVNKCTLNLK